MSYVKTIQPSYEITRGRKKLIGYTGELYDGNILLHSQEYSTNSQAERALDRIVFDLLTDLAEHGMVDDVPAALEAEGVTSTHLPSWQPVPSLYELVVAECQAELDARMAEPVVCVTCGGDGDCPDCDIPNPVKPAYDDSLPYTVEEIAYYSQAGECRMNVLGTYWTVCGAPADGPCYCDVVVIAAPIDVEYAPAGWTA